MTDSKNQLSFSLTKQTNKKPSRIKFVSLNYSGYQRKHVHLQITVDKESTFYTHTHTRGPCRKVHFIKNLNFQCWSPDLMPFFQYRTQCPYSLSDHRIYLLLKSLIPSTPCLVCTFTLSCACAIPKPFLFRHISPLEEGTQRIQPHLAVEKIL